MREKSVRKSHLLLKIIVLIIITTLISIMFNANTVHAEGTITIKGILDAGRNWTQETETPGTSVEEFATMFVGVGQILVAIGTITILIVAAITAIRWLTATPDKQAKLKTQLIGLVISIIVIFGAIGIWNVVRGIMGGIEGQL